MYMITRFKGGAREKIPGAPVFDELGAASIYVREYLKGVSAENAGNSEALQIDAVPSHKGGRHGT